VDEKVEIAIRCSLDSLLKSEYGGVLGHTILTIPGIQKMLEAWSSQ
jgi:hypothetical protein